MTKLAAAVEQRIFTERIEREMAEERHEYQVEQNEERTKELRIKMAKFL